MGGLTRRIFGIFASVFEADFCIGQPVSDAGAGNQDGKTTISLKKRSVFCLISEMRHCLNSREENHGARFVRAKRDYSKD